MIDINNNCRIIGDFFEINADILQKELNSKYPKFISKFIANRERNKLLRVVQKLRNSNHILNSSNLVEYISYIQNNLSESNSYKSVFFAKVNEELDLAEAIIKFEDVKVLISISLKEQTLDIAIEYVLDNTIKKYNIRCESLNRNDEIGPFIKIINIVLLNDISDFITEYISAYKK